MKLLFKIFSLIIIILTISKISNVDSLIPNYSNELRKRSLTNTENSELTNKIVSKSFRGYFKGNWVSHRKYNFFSHIVGKSNMYLDYSIEHTNPFNFKVLLFDGEYSDRALKAEFNFVYNQQIKISNENEYSFEFEAISTSAKIILIQNWSFISQIDCLNSVSKLNFKAIKALNSENFIEKIIGTLKFSCRSLDLLNFDFQTIFDPKFASEYNSKVGTFCTLELILSLFQLGCTYLVIMRIQNENSYADSLSVIGLFINLLWNSYCSMFNFLHIFSRIHILFVFVCFIYFLTFVWVDKKLIQIVFEIQNRNIVNSSLLLQLGITKIYLMFFIIFLISIRFFDSFFYSELQIFFSLSLIWILHIQKNFSSNNRFLPPFLYILAVSLNRLFYGVYFRGFSENYLNLETSTLNTISMCGIVLFQIILMYIHSKFGLKKLIPQRFNLSQEYDYFKTKDDLISMDIKLESIDCVICLNNLLTTEISLSNNYKFFELFNLKLFEILTDFHKIQKNDNRKLFMLTPCKHCFHSICLESWMKQKLECPNCRFAIPSLV